MSDREGLMKDAVNHNDYKALLPDSSASELSGHEADAEERHLPFETPSQVHEVYTRRWFILAIFCSFSASNAFQWNHLTILTDVVEIYYNSSLPSNEYARKVAVDWLAMLYMATYVPFVFPAMWLLNKYGLRLTSILATLFNMLGAAMKCLAVAPDRYMVLLGAQVVNAIGQCFILSIPARLAGVWFGASEVSTATAIGVFGNQIGIAIGFLLPPNVVHKSHDLGNIGRELSYMFYGNVGVATLLFILVLVAFAGQPPLPPSQAQAAAIEYARKENFAASLKKLATHKGFMLLAFSYGINVGCFYALSTLTNPLILAVFPDGAQDAGRIGTLFIITGIFGAVIAGFILDRTKAYKTTTVLIFIATTITMLAFALVFLQRHIWAVYLVTVILGFVATALLPVGFEFGAEITYPVSEGTSSGMLNAAAQVLGIMIIHLMQLLLTKFGPVAANLLSVGFLAVGCIATVLIKPDYRRQQAQNTGTIQ